MSDDSFVFGFFPWLLVEGRSCSNLLPPIGVGIGEGYRRASLIKHLQSAPALAALRTYRARLRLQSWFDM